MVKYGKEQRDRAVDLYVKYERCAADVIHELGYPSRGMLPVWYRERLEEERTGRQSTRGKRYRRYTDEQKQAAVDHYLGHGRRLKRTMRALGYPKSHELLTAWIDELAPGRRKLRHGPVPEELKRKAVVAVASGRLKSREAAAELGVEASVVRNWKRQMLAGSKETHVTKTPGEKPSTAGEGKTGVEPSTPAAMPPAAAGPRDAAGLADAVAALEKRLAETRARLDELDADVERQRREKRELDIEIAFGPSSGLDAGVQLVQTGLYLRKSPLHRRQRLRQTGHAPRAAGSRRRVRTRGLCAGPSVPGPSPAFLRHVRLLGSGEHLSFPVSHDGCLHAQFGGRLA